MKTLMLTIAAVGLCLGACNTMTRGTESEVTITASPRGARIWTSLGHRCPSSPCVVKVERKTDFIAYAEAKGYRQGSIEVKAQLSDKAAPGVIGNAILPDRSASSSTWRAAPISTTSRIPPTSTSPAAAAAGGG